MKLILRCTFITSGQDDIQFETTLERKDPPAPGGERALFEELEADARAALTFGRELDVLPVLSDLTADSGKKISPTDIQEFFGAINAGELWFEIENTFTQLRFYLAQSQAYKLAEPSPEDESDGASSRRYLSHFQKMLRFDCAVYSSVKIQDLLVRLMFERFGTNFIDVDMAKPEWEKKLTMERAKEGLVKLKDEGTLPVGDYDAILDAIKEVNQEASLPIIRYRNRLMHRVRASVDYPELYPYLQGKNGEPILDESGSERGRSYTLMARPGTPEFYFGDLYSTMVEFTSQLATMLNRLKTIPSLA